MGSARELLQDCGPIRFSTSPEEFAPEENLSNIIPSTELVSRELARPVTSRAVSINRGTLTSRTIPKGPRATYAGVLAGTRARAETDPSKSRVGPTPQQLRAFSGFPGQRAPQNPNTALGTGRLQTTKLGANS